MKISILFGLPFLICWFYCSNIHSKEFIQNQGLHFLMADGVHKSTIKNQDTIIPNPSKFICYLISGSFLIPKNADTQVNKLLKLGFTKAYKYNFPNTEFYAVVVDTFTNQERIEKTILELSSNKLEFFTKCL
ncbi:MAG: hypothetical protein WAR77_12875 [Saprospiraceae bacterium]|nr:SPOR domain-containing protein [Saprospiraceae bacterium]